MVEYQLTFVENSGLVSNDKFPGELGQDFATDAVVLHRRLTSIIAPNLSDMCQAMKALPKHWLECELKVDENRCTEFELGNAIFRIYKGDIEPERLIKSMTKFWLKGEPLLRLGREIWEALSGKNYPGHRRPNVAY